MEHQVAEEDQLSAIVTMANVNGMIKKVKVKVKRSEFMETVAAKRPRGHPSLGSLGLALCHQRS